MVYALGITLWEVFSGVLPFSDVEFHTPAQLPFMVLRGERPNLGALLPGTPDGLRELLATMWAASPQDRCSASEAATALRRLGGAHTAPLWVRQ